MQKMEFYRNVCLLILYQTYSLSLNNDCWLPRLISLGQCPVLCVWSVWSNWVGDCFKRWHSGMKECLREWHHAVCESLYCKGCDWLKSFPLSDTVVYFALQIQSYPRASSKVQPWSWTHRTHTHVTARSGSGWGAEKPRLPVNWWACS